MNIEDGSGRNLGEHTKSVFSEIGVAQFENKLFRGRHINLLVGRGLGGRGTGRMSSKRRVVHGEGLGQIRHRIGFGREYYKQTLLNYAVGFIMTCVGL